MTAERRQHRVRRAGVDDADRGVAAARQPERHRLASLEACVADDGFDARGHRHDVVKALSQPAEQPRRIVASAVDPDDEVLHLERSHALGRHDRREIFDEMPKSHIESGRVAAEDPFEIRRAAGEWFEAAGR
jgi:hypothetical protein